MRKILITAAAGLAIPVLAASTASAASKPAAAQASYLRYPCNGAGVCPVLSSVTVSPGTSGIIAVAVMQGANTVAGAPEYFAQVKFTGPGHKCLSVPGAHRAGRCTRQRSAGRGWGQLFRAGYAHRAGRCEARDAQRSCRLQSYRARRAG